MDQMHTKNENKILHWSKNNIMENRKYGGHFGENWVEVKHDQVLFSLQIIQLKLLIEMWYPLI